MHRHGATAHIADPAERDALNELIALLGGYPLPLTAVLPILASTKPSVVLAELKGGGNVADPGGLIRRTVEYSLGKLDPSMQNSLQLLAPFTSVIPTGPFLQDYQELLLQDPTVQRLGTVDIGAALEQVSAIGLATPHDRVGFLMQVQPVLPWFLRSRMLDEPALRAATSQAHYQYYSHFAAVLHKMLVSQDSPQDREHGRVIARAVYANLTSALEYALSSGQLITDLIVVLDEYLDQSEQHELRRQLLDSAITAYPKPEDLDRQKEFVLLHNLAGATAMSQRRPDDALVYFRSELKLTQDLGDRRAEGVIYHNLGKVAEEQRRSAEAEANYRKALDIYLEVDDRDTAAEAYRDLGHMAAKEPTRFAEAEADYRKALEIFLEIGNQYRASGIYGALGDLALQQKRFDEAEANIRKAVESSLEFGARHSAASGYYNLGWVAYHQERFTEAETNYRKALELYLESDDRFGAANTYHRLGILTQGQQRFSEAESYYRRALDVSSKVRRSG